MKVGARRLVVAVVIVLIAAGGAVWWYFSSGHTRIVELPETAQRAVVAAVPGFTMPRPRHILVIVEENKSLGDVIGNTHDAPYLNELAAHGALFTRSFAIAHPSQPNYFALFAGVTTRVGDRCDVNDIPADAPNLGADLLAAHHTFVAYAESLPQPGFRGCSAGEYARKHAPWTHFTNIPDAAIQPFAAFPAHDPSRLADVSFVIPNELDDMHSASIARGDGWLKANLGPLIANAVHDDLVVIVTWDESSKALSNNIPTIFAGAHVKPGRFGETVTHYDVLRTIEDIERIGHDAHAATALPIVDVWR